MWWGTNRQNSRLTYYEGIEIVLLNNSNEIVSERVCRRQRGNRKLSNQWEVWAGYKRHGKKWKKGTKWEVTERCMEDIRSMGGLWCIGQGYIFTRNLYRPTFDFPQKQSNEMAPDIFMTFYGVIDPCTDSQWLSRCRFLRTHTQSNFGFTNLLWRIDTTGGAAVRLMIIREGGRGKSGRLCAHCQAGDCTLCIGSIVEVQPVQTCSLKGL